MKRKPLAAKVERKPEEEGKKAGAGHPRDRSELLALVSANPYILLNVTDIRLLFDIGVKPMRHLRAIAQKDRPTDPWDGDLTRPEKFAEWYWGTYRRLRL